MRLKLGLREGSYIVCVIWSKNSDRAKNERKRGWEWEHIISQHSNSSTRALVQRERVVPALKSMSAPTNWYLRVVVMILAVGTKGWLVTAPLPVVNAIKLQPLAVWPAVDSKSFPGLSMNMYPRLWDENEGGVSDSKVVVLLHVVGWCWMFLL